MPPARRACASSKTCGSARDTYRVRFECPEIARRIVPGQFVMLRLAGMNDPLLGRPLALYNTVGDAARRADCDRRRLPDARQDDTPAGPFRAGDELESGARSATDFPRSRPIT